MNVSSTLLDILVVLLAAKAAAELAERIHIPAVVAEIVAGTIIGSSALNLVHSSDVLRTLGELGVILLLLEVGMSMQLGELAAVGRASTLVAIVGVIVPSAAGLGVALAFGHDFNVALFVGAALAATSVGITARVFSDLRALATVEARTVLGAAVADDVLGLVILTVVVRIATGGSISALNVLGIVAVATGFLVVATVAGQWIGPRLFGVVDRFSRSVGTLVAVAFAFTLAYAKLADAAQLAPIVGAFVAGISLSGSAHRERIQRELRPVGHLFIPIFFLEIGIDAHIQEFVRPAVLGVAGALFVVAVVGKLVAAVGASGSPGDKRLIGLGMIPRGEVGLIFASIGLQNHVLGRDLYAALLLVVLASTIVTPPLLRWRLLRLRAARGAADSETPPPPDGWLRVRDGAVGLNARPPLRLALHVGLEAALALANATPSRELLDWYGSLDAEEHLRWDPEATRLLFRVLLEGNQRSWRFLETTNLLERALPELAAALARRRTDPFELDPVQLLRFSLVDQIRSLTAEDALIAEHWRSLKHPEWLLLAALVIDTAGNEAPVPVARRLVKRLDLGAAAEEEVALLVGESTLLRGAAEHLSALDEEAVLQLAAHLETEERARALAVLTAALDHWNRAERERFDTLISLVLGAISNRSLTGRDAANTVAERRLRAIAEVGAGTPEASRIERAPRTYILSESVDEIAHHAQLVSSTPRRGNPRVHIHPVDSQGPKIEVVARDQPGVLAHVTGALAELACSVVRATVTTWPDGVALEVFQLRDQSQGAMPSLNEAQLARAITATFAAPLRSLALRDADITFNDFISPWYTVCEISARDRPGLLHDIAAGFAAAGVDVHSAQVTTDAGRATDRFELSDFKHQKLSESVEARVREVIAAGVDVTQRDAKRGRRFAPRRRTFTT